MEMKSTPDNIKSLLPHQVFVFGSNDKGRHGKGAALTAKQKFGAIQGRNGLVGQSYGLITVLCNAEGPFRGTRLSLEGIYREVEHFLYVAGREPNLEFLVTKIGCGLAGWKESDIRPMFAGSIPPNVILPNEFKSPK